MIGTRDKVPASWNQEKLDLSGCVLHAPLWRPDMVERYGRLVDGTGVSSTPILVLGASNETITVTTAGTFKIYLPYLVTGTATSGTATLVGSPVSLVAGLNTVDTGVTTGTFTISKTRVLRSRDSNQYTMTVTGAVWGSKGRTFDKSDDRIVLSDSGAGSVLNFTSGAFSVEAWFNCTDLTNNVQLFNRDNGASTAGWYFNVMANGRLMLHTAQAGPTFQQTRSAISTIAINTWYHVMATRSGATVKLYVNGVEPSYSNQPSHIDPASTTSAGRIGIYQDNASEPFGGVIGEVRIYSRALLAAEVLRNYHATKWRYQ